MLSAGGQKVMRGIINQIQSWSGAAGARHVSCTAIAARVLAARSTAVRAAVDKRGAAAFEFALLLPIIMALSFGTIQYALMFYTYNAMSGAARYAALTISRGDRSVSSAETVARSMLPAWVPSGDYTVTITDAAPGAMVSAQISVNGAKAAIIPFLPVPASLVTSPQHQFRKQ
jgi:Flp pilus assembly protein TadG